MRGETLRVTPLRLKKSHTLYRRALKTVPLASQTFSKSATNFVQGASPLFLGRGRGAEVWDVDGNRYIDYVLGLLPIVLGYQDPDVDAAVRAQLSRGITFSLATELEAELAERLVRLIPCAEMVRFGKNGSDATTAAVRLARAYTGRDRIAVCGYHGWHDWYIGTTSRQLGVPEAVRALTSTFRYNDADSLHRLLADEPDGFAAIVVEPAGGEEPRDGFLEALRELASRHGAVLVFDEIVTGFRVDLGGAQKRYGVTPDLACFGKAMGNGMPISALVGTAEIMRWMEHIFFSTTFGGEALSLAAAIATLDKLEAVDAPRRIGTIGSRLKSAVHGIVHEAGLSTRFRIDGPDWRPIVRSVDREPVLAASLLRQELIAHGLLMGGAFNLCLSHEDDALLGETTSAWRRAAAAVADAFASNDPAARLRGKPIQPVFQVRPGGSTQR